jgi:hypothetical protein
MREADVGWRSADTIKLYFRNAFRSGDTMFDPDQPGNMPSLLRIFYTQEPALPTNKLFTPRSVEAVRRTRNSRTTTLSGSKVAGRCQRGAECLIQSAQICAA